MDPGEQSRTRLLLVEWIRTRLGNSSKSSGCIYAETESRWLTSYVSRYSPRLDHAQRVQRFRRQNYYILITLEFEGEPVIVGNVVRRHGTYPLTYLFRATDPHLSRCC